MYPLPPLVLVSQPRLLPPLFGQRGDRTVIGLFFLYAAVIFGVFALIAFVAEKLEERQ